MTTAVSRNVTQVSRAECIQEMHVYKFISAYRAFATGITYLTASWAFGRRRLFSLRVYRGFRQSL
jgi:hypothetical protein